MPDRAGGPRLGLCSGGGEALETLRVSGTRLSLSGSTHSASCERVGTPKGPHSQGEHPDGRVPAAPPPAQAGSAGGKRPQGGRGVTTEATPERGQALRGCQPSPHLQAGRGWAEGVAGIQRGWGWGVERNLGERVSYRVRGARLRLKAIWGLGQVRPGMGP